MRRGTRRARRSRTRRKRHHRGAASRWSSTRISTRPLPRRRSSRACSTGARRSRINPCTARPCGQSLPHLDLHSRVRAAAAARGVGVGVTRFMSSTPAPAFHHPHLRPAVAFNDIPPAPDLHARVRAAAARGRGPVPEPALTPAARSAATAIPPTPDLHAECALRRRPRWPRSGEVPRDGRRAARS